MVVWRAGWGRKYAYLVLPAVLMPLATTHALERFGILCYDAAKPQKESRCQRTVYTNSHVGAKTGSRPFILRLLLMLPHSKQIVPSRYHGVVPVSLGLRLFKPSLRFLAP